MFGEDEDAFCQAIENDSESEDEVDEAYDLFIPSSDAGELAYEVEEANPQYGVQVSGHVLLNQCGTILTRQKHEISGSSVQKAFLQRICSTLVGKSVALMYPEGMLFPGIFMRQAMMGLLLGLFLLPYFVKTYLHMDFKAYHFKLDHD